MCFVFPSTCKASRLRFAVTRPAISRHVPTPLHRAEVAGGRLMATYPVIGLARQWVRAGIRKSSGENIGGYAHHRLGVYGERNSVVFILGLLDL